MNRRIEICSSWNIKNKIYCKDDSILLFLYPMGNIYRDVCVQDLKDYLNKISLDMIEGGTYVGKITYKNNKIRTLLLSSNDISTLKINSFGFIYNLEDKSFIKYIK